MWQDRRTLPDCGEKKSFERGILPERKERLRWTPKKGKKYSGSETWKDNRLRIKERAFATTRRTRLKGKGRSELITGPRTRYFQGQIT